MEFEWDPVKSSQNKKKHGISFDEAMVLWTDETIEIPHIASSQDGEWRGATMGKIDKKVYVAIWTQRHGKIRLISVRRARKNEEKTYWQKI